MRTLMAIVLAATLLQAQDKPAEVVKQEPREAVIIPVKTLTGDSFNRLVGLLRVFPGDFRADDKLRTIVVFAPKEVVEQIRKVVNELDRPGSEAAIGRNIEMTMTFLKCSAKAPAAGAPALPADLEAVAKQLRAATQYKDIALWDIVPIHVQEGRRVDQSLHLPGSPATILIRIDPESVGRKDQGRYVRLSNISFRFQYTNPSSELSLSTAGDFMEGQKTVLGKVSGMDDDTAIFVVIALKVLD
jgi:hypothetical protein